MDFINIGPMGEGQTFTAGIQPNRYYLKGVDSVGTPGGSNTQVQFNNSGVLGGDSGFTYASGAAVLSTSLTDPLHIGGTTTTSKLTLRSTSGVGTTGADIIFQTGNNGATEAMRILDNGNVGIGTASPGQKLEVNGNTIITAGSGGYFSNNNESVAGRISEAFGKGTTVAGNWNTGIGGNITITSTQFRATALGYGAAASGNDSTAIGYLAAAAGTSVVIGSSATDGGVTGSVVIGKSGTISAGGYLAIGNTVTASGTLAALAFGRNSTASGFGTIAIGDLATAANTGSIVINNGFTAVGDTASNQLIIAGGNWPIKEVYFGYGVKSANAAVITTIHGTSGLGTDIAGSSLYIAAGQSTGAGAGGIIKFQTAPVGASSSTINALVDRMTILANGNVGIGTSTVPSLLTVNGLINTKGYTVATLPTGTEGDIAYVTDALSPAFLATVVGGGAVVTPVFFNGTNWIAH